MTFLFILISGLLLSISQQQQPVCGVVDAIDYPVESIESVTLARGYDDFGIYRARWGGNHVGLDVAFREQGNPVYAAARGRVTYANIEGWGEERGVVILEHYFPDNSRYFTVYGHVEETDEYQLPQVGDCVERGDVIAAVGWPASSAQHLHYEVRSFLPDDGGPGYVEGNPLAEGWYHPLDFTMLWQLRLQPGFLGYATFDLAPTLPPVLLDNGTVAIASGETVTVFAAPDQVLWRVTMDAIINGIVSLPGNRVVVRSRSGQTATLAGGHYAALWQVDGPDETFVRVGETLIFVTPDGGLTAYTPEGAALWALAAEDDFERVEHLESANGLIAYSFRTPDGSRFRVLDAAGNLRYEATYAATPVITSIAGGGWLLLADGRLLRIEDGELTVIGPVDVIPRRTAQLAADVIGNAYLFVGDSANSLIAWDVQGGLRWQTTLPAFSAILLSPLLRVDSGCLLYTLDGDGQLTIFNTADGEKVGQAQLYAGGDASGRPNARVLQVDRNNTILMGGGFLSLVMLDGGVLAQDALSACLLG